MVTSRYDRIPQADGDIVWDNNTAKVVGLLDLPITPVPPLNGVIFLDPNGSTWSVVPLGGDITGTPGNSIVQGIQGIPVQAISNPKEGQTLVYCETEGVFVLSDSITPSSGFTAKIAEILARTAAWVSASTPFAVQKVKSDEVSSRKILTAAFSGTLTTSNTVLISAVAGKSIRIHSVQCIPSGGSDTNFMTMYFGAASVFSSAPSANNVFFSAYPSNQTSGVISPSPFVPGPFGPVGPINCAVGMNGSGSTTVQVIVHYSLE